MFIFMFVKVTHILVKIFVNRWVLLSLSGLVLGSTVYELFVTTKGKLDQVTEPKTSTNTLKNLFTKKLCNK